MSNLAEAKSLLESLSSAEASELLLYLAERDRDNSDILSSLMKKLSAAIPELENMSEASKAKRLLKIFSLLIYEYNHLTYDELYNNFFIHSATAEFLEEYAIEAGLRDGRLVMTKATGKIRVGSSKKLDVTATLPLLFTVSNADGSLKFDATSRATISSSTQPDADGVYWADREVNIKATEGGEDYNNAVVKAILTSVSGFDVMEQVGDISGGLDRESDAALRQRILDKREADFLLSDGYFITKTKETFPKVLDMAVIPTPEGFGSIGLVIDTEDLDLMDEGEGSISEYWNSQSVHLLGFEVFVYEYDRIELDLQIELYHSSPLLLNVSGFNEIAHNYVDKLKIGEPFVKEYFEKELVSLAIEKGVKYFKTISPTEDIVKVNKRSKIVLSSGRTIFTKELYTDE